MQQPLPTPMPDFDDLADALLSCGSLASPTDLHGVLCGRFCAGGSISGREWHQMAMQLMDLEQLNDKVAALIDELLSATRAQLQSEDFGVALLLPGDHIGLDMRVQALASWCSSFLHGVGGAGIKGEQTFSPEAAEALRDIAATAQVEIEADSDAESNEAEANYMEIVEYLRVAALTMYLEFAAKKNLH